MKRSELEKMIREIVSELSSTGSGASFSPGKGAQYATPFAFKKGKKVKNKAVDTSKKMGFKKTERPRRPSSTKLTDFLNENIN